MKIYLSIHIICCFLLLCITTYEGVCRGKAAMYMHAELLTSVVSCRITDIRCFMWSYRSHETTDVCNSACIYIVAFPLQTPSYVVIQNSKKQQMMCMLKYIFTVNYDSWKYINLIHSYCFEIIGSVTKRPYVLFYLLTWHFYQTT